MASTDPIYLIVAKIVAPFGIKGEVKANVLTDFPDRLANRTTVFLGREDEKPRMIRLRGIRFHQGQALLTLEGCDDRNAAEALRGPLRAHSRPANAPALPAGAYYLHQIIGLEVVEARRSRPWGTDQQLCCRPPATMSMSSTASAGSSSFRPSPTSCVRSTSSTVASSPTWRD